LVVDVMLIVLCQQRGALGGQFGRFMPELIASAAKRGFPRR
jgi:hypothetical protein